MKSGQTTNFLYLCDSKGILIAISEPISCEHHDLVHFKERFQELILWLEKAEIPIGGLFLNADAGFDSLECRKLCQNYQIEVNIVLNTRNATVNRNSMHFDGLLYQNRFVIKRAFAWLDAFKAILVRSETKADNWLNLNIMAMIICFIRKISPKLEC